MFWYFTQSIIFITTIDVSVPVYTDTPPGYTGYERSLLDSFFEKITEQGRGVLSHGNISRPHCEWEGLTCEEGVVKFIFYSERLFGNFQLQFVPSQVTYISIFRCTQKYRFDTRVLPRDIGDFYMTNNRLYGHVDLTTLPNKLRILFLSWNDLTGPINLLRLPKTLQQINLMANKIDQRVLYYGHFSENFQSIQLKGAPSKRNYIGKILPIDDSYKIQTKKIFE